MQGRGKRKKVKVYYIGVQNFVRLLETRHTQQISWRTFFRYARDLLHPGLVCLGFQCFTSNINKVNTPYHFDSFSVDHNRSKN